MGNADGSVVVCFRDATGELSARRELEHRAMHDTLTGLPNRELLMDRLTVALARLGRQGTAVGVLFIDLDGFKEVNDVHGHQVGDELLVHVAGRLRREVRDGDTVARYGGDEFVVLCEDLLRVEAAQPLAERLAEAVAKPVSTGERLLVVHASIGVVVEQNPRRALRRWSSGPTPRCIASSTARARPARRLKRRLHASALLLELPRARAKRCDLLFDARGLGRKLGERARVALDRGVGVGDRMAGADADLGRRALGSRTDLGCGELRHGNDTLQQSIIVSRCRAVSAECADLIGERCDLEAQGLAADRGVWGSIALSILESDTERPTPSAISAPSRKWVGERKWTSTARMSLTV